MKHLKLLCICFTFFSCSFLHSTNDSLVKFNELQLNSEFEKELFKNYSLGKANYDIIDLFLLGINGHVPNNIPEIKKQINQFVETITTEVQGKTDDKKVKIIFKEVHKKFFKKYSLRNSFSDIFSKGEYNCVSGSALYAIIFSKMNIPYEIIEKPNHVFLTAYPASYKILIESTDPNYGYISFSEIQIQKFINYLYASKVITKEELETTNSTTLFNKYYFDNKTIQIQELAGFQLSNYSAYHMQDDEMEKSLNEIKKAYYLMPNDRNKYILQSILGYNIHNNKYAHKKDIDNLCVLCRINHSNKKSISDELIEYEFGRLILEQLINANNPTQVIGAFQQLKNCINDTSLLNKVSFLYHYEMARIGFQKSESIDNIYLHLLPAYKINPIHAELQFMIKGYFSALVKKDEDALSVLKTMDEIVLTFPFLKNDNDFNTVKATCYLELCYQHITLNEISKGEAYKEKYETMMDINSEIKPQEYYIEKAYSSLATYYFKKGNKIKTKEVLKKGISYAPNNFGLKIRLNQLN